MKSRAQSIAESVLGRQGFAEAPLEAGQNLSGALKSIYAAAALEADDAKCKKKSAAA
jgi:hypothetical protein